MKPITVVGAGFSGLTLAYELTRLGLPVEIFEKAAAPGGLIATRHFREGMVETAANALLASREIEHLFENLQIEFAERLPTARRRYVFGSRKPQRWPLSFWTSLRAGLALGRDWLGSPAIAPRSEESVRAWINRIGGEELDRALVGPALQGVYAGDSGELSAGLIWRALKTPTVRGCHKGSVAPARGMGQLIEALAEKLTTSGVAIEYGREFRVETSPDHPVAICTTAWAAAECVREFDPDLAARLRVCESLPLVSVTAFFKPTAKDLQGFGCLFPEHLGFQALGALFNSSIFAKRSDLRSETWIFGGGRDPGAATLSDVELQQRLLLDRARVLGRRERLMPEAVHIVRWPRAIPSYSVTWEKALRGLAVRRPVFLHGNYLGQLGLARIYARSIELAAELKELYVS